MKIRATIRAAARMCTAARTAPKGHGKNIFFNPGFYK